MLALGLSCLVESGAGLAAFHPDEAYRAAGAEVVARSELLARADVLLGPGWVSAGATRYELARLPRIARAQSMDVLSSFGTLAGYRAALLAASRCPRLFPMLTTAAGTLPPAEVLVLGAGVAGLMAMATARRLGAVVTGYDIRPGAQEEIKSVGARCLAAPAVAQAAGEGGYAAEQPEEVLRRQREGLAEAVRRAQVVIATASVPGRPAPVLITPEMVEAMPAGAVIVDLAGGNCALSEHPRVTILRPRDLAWDLPTSAAQMLSRNLVTFLELLVRHGEDELVVACRV